MKNLKNCFNLILVLIICLVLPRNTKGQKTTLKVMSYNIWNGFDWGKDSERKKNCIGFIKNKKPDVLALQELCGYDEEKLKKDALEWGHAYVQILKTDGYPTALTSKQPIILKGRNVADFWHGLLHCQTYGIDFYVVHLSPADCNIRLGEAQMIRQLIKESKSEKYIILGDFNAHSPHDAFILEKNISLKQRYIAKNTNPKYANLRNGEYDYSTLSTFLACPAIDLGFKYFKKAKRRYTFPAPTLIGKFGRTKKSIKQTKERIDYILASPSLAKSCQKIDFFNQKETHYLSDHFPIMAVFNNW